ncbi:MAG: nucleoside-diphosphate-sugar pyrophosphorylase [halophilic archaeon J07HX5]|nr:MAG: nucleoside-diphosphate-sugar pyrophosphorylase [halophilic archaeon J07HX5]
MRRNDRTTAVILAAGEGRRLAPLTNRRPKPMLPVVNKPLLEHVVEAVVGAGIDRIVLVVGYQRKRIQTYFGDGDEWGIDIEYAVQRTQLGTAHALEQAAPLVEGRFVALNGDRLLTSEIVDQIADSSDDTTVTMAVTRASDPSTYGVVSLDGTVVTSIVEKPGPEAQSRVINAGVYGFTQTIFDVIEKTDPGPDGEYRLTDAIGQLVDSRDRVRAVQYNGRWLDVSHPWDLLSVTGQLLDTAGKATLGQRGAGAEVSDAARLADTASVGTSVVVGRGTVVGENARIGANATVERSVVFPDATVEAGAVLRDCIVGANASVGANTTVPGGAATVTLAGDVYEGVRLGGVIGDNTTVGGGATLHPGTILGDSVKIAPGVSVSGTIDDETAVRSG